MPTARELLEQADALMRRNRMSTGGDAASRPATPPVTTPPTGSPASGPSASPRTIQREPIAPSVARTSLPVDPTESPAFAAGAPVEAPAWPPVRDSRVSEPPSQAEAEFPLLTDAVDEAKADAGAPLDDLADDVPLLTDAVEEIDVGIVDEAARGEPSIWELTTRGEMSVLGPAPDSIVVVPMPEAVPPVVPQSPPEGRDPLGFDQPPAGYLASDSTGLGPPDLADRPAATPPDDARPPDRNAGDFAPPGARDVERVFSVSMAESAPEDAEEEAVARESRAEAPAEATAEAPSDANTETLDETLAAGTPYRPPPQVPELDQKRIREIAEEIGMQVLQRIDIFTDTTLRAQLGERLRPVVDRAAADLVAAINENIGELLRAQISEAIEREIESWRDHQERGNP